MESIYKILICRKCQKSTIVLNYEAQDTIVKGKYLACAHCGSKKFKEEMSTDNARECMKSSHYKRVKGALRQVE